MTPRVMAALEALASKQIELLPIQARPNGTSPLDRHFVFFRNGYAALVERRPEGFGRVGTAGIVTEHGLAMLVQRDGAECFVIREHEQAPEPGELEELRQFQADLVQCLAAAADS
jgi:hypothetical protein